MNIFLDVRGSPRELIKVGFEAIVGIEARYYSENKKLPK